MVNIREVIIVLFITYILAVCAICKGKNVVLNDEYCDCSDGSDELLTSACSHITSRPFQCKYSVAINVTLPFSRVNDGICDCCDGSDEVSSVVNETCPNTCEVHLIAKRNEALAFFRTVQAGRKVRADLIHAERRRKLLEQKKITKPYCKRRLCSQTCGSN